MSTPDPRQALVAVLCDPDGPHLAHLLTLVSWVSQQRQVARYGYPRDDMFERSPSPEACLAERDFVAALIEAEREEEAPDGDLLFVLEQLLDADQSPE